jgi:PAS domain S-box-containing protein
MKDEDKTREQLVAEFAELRQRIAELEASGVDHKRVEERLRFQANALDQIGDAVIAVDDEQRVTYLNRAAAEQYEVNPDDALGCKLTELYQYSWLKPEHEQAAYASLAEKGYWSGENIHIKRSGDRICVESAVSVLQDDSGRDTGMLAVMRDITERKRVQEILYESEERFRTIADFTYDWEYWIGPDWEFVYISPSCERITGYRQDEFLEEPELLQKIVHPDDHATVAGHIREEQEDGDVHWINFRIITRSGEERWIEHICRPVYDTDGNWWGWRASNRDITERKRAEEERERLLAQITQDRESTEELARVLERERDALQTIMESTHAQLAYFDPQFNFLRVNSAYAQGSGYSKEELIGHNHFDLFPHAENQAIFERVRETGEPVLFHAKPFEYPARPELGTTYWDWNLVPVKDRYGEVKGLVLSLLDVTERERARQEREAHLASLNTLIAVSEQVLAETTVEGVLQQTVGAARKLTGARMSIAGHSYEDGVFQVGATSRSEDMPPCPPEEDFDVWEGGVYLDLIEGKTSLRLTDEQLRQHPAWQELPEEHVPLQGLLGARLVGRDGQTKGLIMTSGKKEGDFTAEDEALLIQLSALASLGLWHIEARNEAERRADELETERAKLRAIIENAPEGIVVADEECRILLTNPAADGIYALPVPYGQDFESHAELGLCHLDGTPYDPRDLPLTHSALDGETIRNLEVAIRWPDGQRRDLLVNSAPIRDSQGEVSGAVAVLQDITQRKRMLKALQRRNRDLRMLNRLGQELGATLDLPQVLERVLEAIQEVIVAAGSLVWLWDEENPGWLVCRAALHPEVPNSPLNLRLRSGEGVAGWVVEHGESAIVSHASEDPRFSPAIDVRTGLQIHSILAVPLQARGTIIGVLEMVNKADSRFSGHDRMLLETLAASATIAIENARLYDQAKQAAAAAERSRLARELHDAVSQTLFSASIIAESLPRLWERDPGKVRRGLKQLHQLTRGALAEMRTLLLELRPRALVDAELGDLLQQVTEAFAARTPVEVSLTVEGQHSLPSEVQTALYRITQEALNNVTKHARATQVNVSLRRQPEGVELCIRDDGCGFDPARVQPGHLGLDILRERTEAIGATLQVTSQVGHGTEIAVIWSDTQQRERKAND